jgi:pimeloyl-ACP methyl ester carboxylesterase
LERIAPPVLVVHGTEDEAAPYAMGAALARRAPNAELLTIEGGRHVSLFTHLDEIRARVGEFLNRHGTAAAAPSSVRESGS